jgi:hypothetical protein
VDRQPKINDGEENMIRVHKSTNMKLATMATASISITQRHFDSTQALTNNFPELIRKQNVPFSEN